MEREIPSVHTIKKHKKPQILSAVFVVLLFFAVGFFKLLYEIQERGAVKFVCFDTIVLRSLFSQPVRCGNRFVLYKLLFVW